MVCFFAHRHKWRRMRQTLPNYRLMFNEVESGGKGGNPLSTVSTTFQCFHHFPPFHFHEVVTDFLWG